MSERYAIVSRTYTPNVSMSLSGVAVPKAWLPHTPRKITRLAESFEVCQKIIPYLAFIWK